MEIRDILQQFNVQTAPEGHHHRTSYFEQVDCPWCSPHSGRWRLGLAKNGRTAKCWTCGSHYILDTLVEITNQPKYVIKELLKGITGVFEQKKLKQRGKLVLPEGLGPLLPIHKKYLANRGFDWKQLEYVWGLQGIGINPVVGWRIFIPVIYKERTVSWTARALTDDLKTRYWNAKHDQEEISQKEILFGIDLVQHAVIVCEGPFDAMRIGPGAVSTMGIAYTKSQLKQMVDFPIRVICFDTEPDAQKRAIDLCEKLNSFPGKTINVALDSKDPGCASKKEIRELRKRFLK